MVKQLFKLLCLKFCISSRGVLDLHPAELMGNALPAARRKEIVREREMRRGQEGLGKGPRDREGTEEKLGVIKACQLEY